MAKNKVIEAVTNYEEKTHPTSLTDLRIVLIARELRYQIYFSRQAGSSFWRFLE